MSNLFRANFKSRDVFMYAFQTRANVGIKKRFSKNQKMKIKR